MGSAFFFAAGLRLLAGGRVEAVPSFEQPELRSQNGSAMLRWSEPAAGTAQPYQVEHARESDFSDAEVIYVGRMPSAHVSGLRDGVHRFRVRVTDAPNAAAGTSVARRSDLPNWSAPAVLRVEHHSMLVVWPLMALGASVFLATAGFVARHAGAQGRSA